MFHSAHTRRRASTTTITTMVLTAVLLIAGASTLSAQTPNKKALVGSWLGTVTFPPEFGRPPLKYVGSFYEDGTMVPAIRAASPWHRQPCSALSMESGHIWNSAHSPTPDSS